MDNCDLIIGFITTHLALTFISLFLSLSFFFSSFFSILTQLLFIFAASVFLAKLFCYFFRLSVSFFGFQLQSSVTKRKAFQKNKKIPTWSALFSEKRRQLLISIYCANYKWITRVHDWLIDWMNAEYVLYETVKMKSAQGESLAHWAPANENSWMNLGCLERPYMISKAKLEIIYRVKVTVNDSYVICKHTRW